MKIAIIGTVGLPANYGGFEMFVDHLTQKLNNQYNITVYCSIKKYTTKLREWNGVTLKYIPLNANGIQSILYDIISILHALRKNDVILILGVSGCIILPFVKFISSKKIITNIDGLEWARGKWNRPARWLLKLSERLAVKFSDEVIADNKVIQDYIKSEYTKDSILIEYGSDHVNAVKIKKDDFEKHHFLKGKYAFTVCRIETENNIHVILEAFKQSGILPLIIVGDWSFSAYSMELKNKYSAFEHIILLDPIYDKLKLNLLRSNCYVYIHGHSVGGTNPSLIEAMYLKLPIIAYDVNFNRETTENKALYFTNSNDLQSIINGIKKLNLRKISKDLFEIAQRRYTWDNISLKYSKLFNKL